MASSYEKVLMLIISHEGRDLGTCGFHINVQFQVVNRNSLVYIAFLASRLKSHWNQADSFQMILPVPSPQDGIFPSTRQAGKRASWQTGNQGATSQPGDWATSQLGIWATGQPPSWATGKRGIQATRQPGNQATGQLGNQASGHLGNWATGQMATLNWATGQPRNWATRQPGNQATRQLCNWATGQPSNWPTGQPGNQATGQPGNRQLGKRSTEGILPSPFPCPSPDASLDIWFFMDVHESGCIRLPICYLLHVRISTSTPHDGLISFGVLDHANYGGSGSVRSTNCPATDCYILRIGWARLDVVPMCPCSKMSHVGVSDPVHGVTD